MRTGSESDSSAGNSSGESKTVSFDEFLHNYINQGIYIYLNFLYIFIMKIDSNFVFFY